MGTRPASLVAWILGIAFVIACPQSLTAALATASWLLTDPAGTAVLGVLFVVSLAYAVASGVRGYGMRRAW